MPTTKRFVLTRHALARITQRFDHAPVTNLSIQPPQLPKGIRYPLQQPGRGTLWMTASAFFVADGPTVMTLVPVPVEILAAVLVRLLFRRWVIDDDDGFIGTSLSSRSTARRAKLEWLRNAAEKAKRLRQKKHKKNRRYT